MGGRVRRRAKKVIDFLIKEMGVKKIRFPATSGIGIKPVSREGTERLVRKAIQYAIDNDRQSVTLVHKGNIMKFTEGALPRLGLRARAEREFGAQPIDGGPWMSVQEPEDRPRHRRQGRDRRRLPAADPAAAGRVRRDRHAQPQRRLHLATRSPPQVGGIGIAPGANLSDTVAMFEATHGTAPKYAGKDYVNPGSEILSAEMMLRPHGLEGGRRPDHREPREGDRATRS